MDLTNSTVWFAIAIVFITTVICKVAIKTNKHGPACDGLLPPVVNSGSIIGLLYTLLTKGFQAMIYDQYKKLGSVFTLSFFGVKATFLVGPEVSGHFFQGLDSEICQSDALEFLSPIIGKEVFGIDSTSRKWHIGFLREGLKPGKLRDHVKPMVQEVEDYFAKWGQQGVVDLKQEMEQVLMVITGRCLLGKEVREQMFGEVCDLFHELFDNGMRITSILFPYAPTTTNQRRDKARAKLSEIFTNIVQSRKNSNHVEDDMLQNLIDSKYVDGRPTTIEEVVGLIITLILAGQHSSSNTGTWTGGHLLNDTRCLMAVIEEQKQIIKKHGSSIDFNVFLEMDVLHNSIKEALRMHPPGILNLRKVLKNFTVRTKEGMEYEIPRGHTIVSPTVLNTNIDYIYKNPKVYDPDRFGPGRAEDKIGGKFSYTPFGGGRHACLGEAYAFLQIKVVWSHLVRNFELKLESPFPNTDRSTITMEPKGKIMVSYTRRQLLTTCGKLACP